MGLASLSVMWFFFFSGNIFPAVSRYVHSSILPSYFDGKCDDYSLTLYHQCMFFKFIFMNQEEWGGISLPDSRSVSKTLKYLHFFSAIAMFSKLFFKAGSLISCIFLCVHLSLIKIDRYLGSDPCYSIESIYFCLLLKGKNCKLFQVSQLNKTKSTLIG